MDGLALLLEAQAAGLRVSREADKLVIRGPRRAEPIAHKLLAHKATVLDALKASDQPRPEQHRYDPFADLPPNDVAYRGAWQRWFALLVRHKHELGNAPTQQVGGRTVHSPTASQAVSRRTWQEAHTLAYGEAQCLWHERYGQRPDPHHCAGCGGPIGQSVLFTLPDGARIHDDAALHCLQSYGERWRTAAADALQRLGITSREPDGIEADRQP